MRLTGATLTRLAGLGLLLGLLAVRALDPLAVQTFRAKTFDLFQQIKPRAAGGAPVTVVDIDDRSLLSLGQWPWSRAVVARLIDAVAAQGAVVIGLDILFAEPDRLSPERLAEALPDLPPELADALARQASPDKLLAEAIARSRVVVGQASARRAGGAPDGPDAPPPVPHAFIGGDPTGFLPRFPELVENLPEIEAAAAGRGVFTVLADADGVLRRVPLALLASDTLRLSLGPELLRVGTGGDAVALRRNDAGVEAIVLAGKSIPTQSDATVLPWFAPSDPARFVSAADLLGGAVPPDRLRGHIVLVGTSAVGLGDFLATPLGVPMPGVEIHAQLVEAILGDALLVRPNYAVGAELSLLAAVGLLLVVVVPWLPARGTIEMTGLLVLGLGAASWLAFDRFRILLDPSFPVVATAVLAGMMAAGNYLREERARRDIRGAFGHYVSPALVEQLARAPDRLRLGGERRDITVLFSDVRGFTEMAEGYGDRPEELTALMNALLTALSDGVLSAGGTIDKFMGDAVMAFWNAPLDDPDHARAACRGALAMLANLSALNRARGLRIDVGVGINTGPAIVGNMGSAMRFDYTALGDTVNLAARLEGLSKPYGLPVVIGESTARAVSGDFAVIEIDRLRVPGRRSRTRLFALLGDARLLREPGWEMVETFNAAMIEAWRLGDWTAAEAALDALAEAAGPLDLPLTGYVKLYRARIAAHRHAPPPPGWDGVATAEGQ